MTSWVHELAVLTWACYIRKRRWTERENQWCRWKIRNERPRGIGNPVLPEEDVNSSRLSVNVFVVVIIVIFHPRGRQGCAVCVPESHILAPLDPAIQMPRKIPGNQHAAISGECDPVDGVLIGA